MINDASSAHRMAWDLIPWIVNGTASDTERQVAEAHMRGCADCREELEFQQRLQQHITSALVAPVVPVDSPHSWQLLRARLNAAVPAQEAAVSAQRQRRRPGYVRWLVAAVVAQSIGLGALALALAVHAPTGASPAPPASSRLSGAAAAASLGTADGAYRTLSSAQASAPTSAVRAVFAPEMTLAQLQALLERAHLQMVSGPHEGGVWRLAPPSGTEQADNVVRELRADPQVRFAAADGGSP